MSENFVAIVDYEVGNVRSVENALRAVDCEVRLTRKIEDLRAAACIVLPGVGAFGDAMKTLRATGLIPVLEKEAFERKKPFISFCVGMQILFERSEEDQESGLGWLPGDVVKFQVPRPLTVPHFGWNNITVINNPWLFEDMGHDKNFYFAHSYHAVPRAEHIVATCDYGYTFAAAVRKDNIVGMQFHPEKSHKSGLALLRNFTRHAMKMGQND